MVLSVSRWCMYASLMNQLINTTRPIYVTWLVYPVLMSPRAGQRSWAELGTDHILALLHNDPLSWRHHLIWSQLIQYRLTVYHYSNALKSSSSGSNNNIATLDVGLIARMTTCDTWSVSLSEVCKVNGCLVTWTPSTIHQTIFTHWLLD